MLRLNPWTLHNSVVLFIMVLSIPLSAQQSGSLNSSENQQAEVVLNSALSAMGGQALWAAISDATVSGTCESAGVDGTNSGAASPFLWINAQDQFRYENGPSDNLTIMLSGHGKPLMVFPTQTQSLTYETAEFQKPFHLPGLVLQSTLNDQNYQLVLVGNENTSGTATIHVRILHRLFHIMQPGSRQDWWFDASTFLPLKVTFKVPGQAVESYMDVTYTFSGWSADVSGLMVPHQILITNEFGADAQTCTVLQLKINTQPAASLFDAR